MRTNLLLAGAVLALAATTASAADLQKGSPSVKSVSALAFGPDGVLFIGDPSANTIYAVATGDTTKSGSADLAVDKLDDKIGSMLGVQGKDVIISDVKVNPISGNVYVAASRAKGAAPVVVRVARDGSLSEFSLKDVPFSSVKLPNGSGEAITNMAFIDGKVIVAGVSTEEFASTLRLIPFPFSEADKGTGIEIFHGAHGKLETRSPVRTFTPYKANGTDYILASYTCTPLVRIPLSDLKPGTKVRGVTVAELGNRNKPLDMIVYNKGGKDYLLMANSARGVMKIPTEGVESATAITSKPAGLYAGMKAENISDLKDVTQLDKLDANRALILVQAQGGSASLKTIPLP